MSEGPTHAGGYAGMGNDNTKNKAGLTKTVTY